MEQLGKGNAERRRRYFILSVIITIIALRRCADIRNYSRHQTPACFVLNSDLPGAQTNRPVLGFISRIYGLFSRSRRFRPCGAAD